MSVSPSRLLTRPRRRGVPSPRVGRRAAIALGILGAAALAVSATVVVARTLFERQISDEIEELFTAAGAARGEVVTEADLVELPEPVQRWLRHSQVVGKERPVTVRLKQEGEFRLGDRWVPFGAEQYFTTDPPGFVWKATFTMAPLVSVVGRDRYAGGAGTIEMRVLGLVPVADSSGAGLNQGALLRYLGETVWFPAGVLSPYITWQEIDERSARASMSHGGVTAAATFSFDEQGRVTDITADRFSDEKGRIEAWWAHNATFGELDGIRIPVGGDGTWRYAAGDFPYIRWRVTDLETNPRSRY